MRSFVPQLVQAAQEIRVVAAQQVGLVAR